MCTDHADDGCAEYARNPKRETAANENTDGCVESRFDGAVERSCKNNKWTAWNGDGEACDGDDADYCERSPRACAQNNLFKERRIKHAEVSEESEDAPRDEEDYGDCNSACGEFLAERLMAVYLTGRRSAFGGLL